MRRSHLLLSSLTIALGASGCPTRPAGGLAGFDCDPKTGVCSPRDGGSSSADGGDGGGVTVQITRPTSPAHTNGAIAIEIAFVPPSDAPASADLFDGSTKIATVVAPFTFTWDTGAAPPVTEGLHEITARATVAGQPISSPPVTINVDRIAPQIVDRAPVPAATSVLLAEPIHILFSEPIDPATLPGAITLSAGGGMIATTAALAADGKAVTISLSDRHAIALPADVTVSVKPTLADLAGNQLGPTGAWTWTAPSWVKLPVLAGKYPELALGADDRPVIFNAVEQDAIGSNDFVLQLARLGPTRTWDTTVPSPQGARPASRVSSGGALAVAPDGSPVVAWSEVQGTTPATVRVAKWSGSAWDKSYGQLDAVAGSGTGAGLPSLGHAPSGDLFVAWAELNPTVTTVFAARWRGTAWDVVYGNVGVAGAASSALRFGLDGQPVLAYDVSLNDNGVSRWTGGSWSTLPTYKNYIESPSLAIDASDRPVVVSQTGQASDRYLRLYFWNQSMNVWQEEIPAVPTGLSPGGAQLIIPADGHPIIAWTEFDTMAGERVVRVTRHTGAQWDFSYGSLDGFPGANSSGGEPRIVLDRGGSPIVAWQETDGTFASTYVWRSNRQ